MYNFCIILFALVDSTIFGVILQAIFTFRSNVVSSQMTNVYYTVHFHVYVYVKYNEEMLPESG